MGTLFMVNPPRRKSRKRSGKRRSAKQRAATQKMLAARKRQLRAKRRRVTVNAPVRRRRRKAVVVMAKRKRRRAVARRSAPRRRRRTSARRRSPVTALRRRAVYVTNRPKRRVRRRSRYRRNPPIMRQLQQGAMDAGGTLVGGAVARMLSGMLPLPKEGLAGVASQFAVALGVGFGARQFLSADTSRFIIAGALQVPVKNLITTFIPQAGAFLGDYDNVGAYALPAGNGDMGNYLTPGMYGYGAETENVEIGVYE